MKITVALSEPKLPNTEWTAFLGSISGEHGGATLTADPSWTSTTLSSSALSLLRERRCVWRCVLEGSHPCPVLCQRQGPDLLRPTRDQTGRPAESAGVLHGLLPLLLPEPHSHLQLEEEGERAVSVSSLPGAVRARLGWPRGQDGPFKWNPRFYRGSVHCLLFGAFTVKRGGTECY